MACTAQTAKQYVENARIHLVGRLKSLSVIVENLYQRRVFNEEEVSKIHAECDDFDKSREIIDKVVKKGEAACYEFLKIVNITRKRTLERPLERTGPASSRDRVEFDLHYWISCFSFDDEPTGPQTNYSLGPRPCHRYQAQLKCKASKIVKETWKSFGCMLRKGHGAALSYTPLVLDTQRDSTLSKIQMKNKKSNKSRFKKMKTYIPVDTQETSPNELLKTNENKILLVGKPGIGKTTVTHQMLNLWMETETEVLDYMFYFDMRDLSPISNPINLEGLLFDWYCEPKEYKEEVLKDIKENSDNVIIIFDGIADLSSSSLIKKIIEKELLPNAKVVITCRPEVESEDLLSEWSTLRVEVKGFSVESIKKYLAKMLSAMPDSQSSVSNNMELFSLCHVPMYASMVVACISFHPLDMTKEQCTITEMYVNILRNSIKKHSGVPQISIRQLDCCISDISKKILSLAEIAFDATEKKTVHLTGLSCEQRGALFSFLRTCHIQISPTELKTYSSFLHYTMQEFFAALWLLQNSEMIRGILRECLTEERKHMKHVVPFICGLLNVRNLESMKCLIPDPQNKKMADSLVKEVVSTFLPSLTNQEDQNFYADLQFLCQCLYESHSTEACLLLLEKLDYELDLRGEHLDPHYCCTVAYVINQGRERKVTLNLEGCTVSEQGIGLLLGCLQKVQSLGADPSLLCDLWTTSLQCEAERDFICFLGLCKNELHLPALGKKEVFERAGGIIKDSQERANLYLHWDHRTPLSEDLKQTLVECLTHINSLSFTSLKHKMQSSTCEVRKKKELLLDLCLLVSPNQREMFRRAVNTLFSLFSVYQTERYDILLDLYSRAKCDMSEKGRIMLSSLKPLYQSAPAVWSIDLSRRKVSLLLEVLKLQPEKKILELRGWSDAESEVRTFLQCLPHISQLRCTVPQDQRVSVEGWEKKAKTFLLNICLQAALHERGTIQSTMETLLSLSDVYYNQKYDFLLDLYSHMKDYETQTGMTVLPALQPVYQSPAPAVWFIDLSKRKASLLLEVLKLQPEKKPVELRGWSDEESDVRSFLQCLPYISQLSVEPWFFEESKIFIFLVKLLSQAAEWEEQTGEKTLKLLSSVCSYKTFPYRERDDYDEYDDDQSGFLLDLCSHVKDCEAQTSRTLLPALQTAYLSAAPTVWCIDLSKRKASLLLEVLKLQLKKKPVKLSGRSFEESEVRSFLQCLPYISQFSCEAGFFQHVCETIPVRSREEAQQLVPLLQALDFTLELAGDVPKQTCKSVGRVLGLCASQVDLTLTPSKISLKGASLLLRHVARLHKLRLNESMAVILSRLVKTERGAAPVIIEELSLVLMSPWQSEAAVSRVVSRVASLLRLWSVQCLDLTEFSIPPHSVITLLSHHGPLTLRLQSQAVQQLAVVLYEAQDKELTQSFLKKLGGDLTSCSLDWDVLHYLLQQSTQNNPARVDFKKNKLSDSRISDILPYLDRVVIKRPSPTFIVSAIRQIYESRASDRVSSFLTSVNNVINLNARELNMVDCAALCFILQHRRQIHLNLLWTSIPSPEIESILPLLDGVSQLSIDRKLLLKFLHCCPTSPVQQGAVSSSSSAAVSAELLWALQFRLDFSCSSSVDLLVQEQGETLCLSVGDCRNISTVLRDGLLHTPLHTQPQLILKDCEVEDAALRELLPIMYLVKLSTSKGLLLQLMEECATGESTPRYAESLCRALGGELDLSETRLDPRVCRSLALVLEHSEGLSELDLSHCHLTDQHLELLLTHLHKVQVLDLSHNVITDTLTDRILKLVSENHSIQTVRLFQNKIINREPFLTDKRFEIW